MSWTNRSWEQEDTLYAPKRKVSNRGSQKRPHVIGAYYSPKMLREVEYESLGEYLFYSLLELDPQTVRYYVQPVEVPIPGTNKHGKPSFWPHVSDVLVFREHHVPHLFQVKESTTEVSNAKQIVDEYCKIYAFEKGWQYSVVYPKSIPVVVARNAKFLMGFLKARKGFDALIPELISRLTFLHSSKIHELARGFQGNMHPLQVLPIIYHLTANGTFAIDINEELNQFSEVMIRSEQSVYTHYLTWGE